jgi:small conductance mechanosensitive channel
VGVSYGSDLRQAREAALAALAGVPGRDTTRDSEVFYEQFGDSSIDLTARFWIPFERETDFLSARSEAVVRIKDAFDAAGITIPFPIRTLDFSTVGGRLLSEELQTSRSGRLPEGK